MFLIDRLLIGAPVAGLKFVFRQIATVAEQEIADDEERVLADIRDLHRRLEEGAVDEARFAVEERALMERWRAIKTARLGTG